MSASSGGIPAGPDKSAACRLAVIGGTGVYDPSMLEGVREELVDTPYGPVSVRIGRLATGGARLPTDGEGRDRSIGGGRGPAADGGGSGAARGEEVAFLSRHGTGHAVPPHRVNHRANVWALKSLGVERVLATAAVGSLSRDMKPGDFVLLDQFLDFTRGRASTFYEGAKPLNPGAPRGVVHVDVTAPYCPDLRRVLADTAAELGVTCHPAGTYVCTEGPRFETAAEIRMYAQLGGHVVGMTGVPEVVLARELSLCYAAVAMVTNFAAGIADRPLTHSEVVEVMAANAANLRALFGRVLAALALAGGEQSCRCGEPVEVHGAS